VAIAETVTPAVVRIETSRTRRAASRGQTPPVPEEFRQFFRMPDPGQSAPVRSGGSGFLVSEDGYILTNDHVVAGAEEIRVFLQDRREFSATLVGADPTTDVAVIKIESGSLPSMSFGSSDAVRVGEWVLAVGNPGFGSGNQLDYTVTAGIVSAKGRPLGLINNELRIRGNENSQFAIEDFIQTDAVINPGNSGGPLVDLRGQVVGINSAIASETGYYQGYGFAIPIDLARRVMEDLIEYGVVRRSMARGADQRRDPRGCRVLPPARGGRGAGAGLRRLGEPDPCTAGGDPAGGRHRGHRWTSGLPGG
jgi:serine protease Do